MDKETKLAKNEKPKRSRFDFIRAVFRRVTKFFTTAAIIIVILFSPFWGSMVYNEIRLIIFDSQMSKIEQIFREYNSYYKLIAKGRNTSIGGNCNCISYGSVRVYRIILGKEEKEEVLQKIRDMTFRHAVLNSPDRHPDSKPEVYVYYNTLTLTVEIMDGAYGAGLDFRFW